METFNEIINGEKPVLVDFYATWCGPCKMMMPTIEEMSKKIQGEARILKIDIDKNQKLAEKYKVQVVPTFILFKEGKPVWRNSGVLDRQILLQAIKDNI